MEDPKNVFSSDQLYKNVRCISGDGACEGDCDHEDCKDYKNENN